MRVRIIFPLNLRHKVFGALLILYIAVLKVRKMNNFIPDRKIVTIEVFDTPTSKNIFLNTRAENAFFFIFKV